MDKYEWFNLVEYAHEASAAISCGDPQLIVDKVLNLTWLIDNMAGDAAEQEGWFSELEKFIDELSLASRNE